LFSDIIQSSLVNQPKGTRGDTEMQTINDLMDMAKKINGRARSRTIGEDEAKEMLELVANADDAVHTIRVYSGQGFVPNSYKYRCEIRYFEATRKEGQFVIGAGYGDAKRSHGNGALVTVNKRGI
jgi:hypothetical protein